MIIILYVIILFMYRYDVHYVHNILFNYRYFNDKFEHRKSPLYKTKKEEIDTLAISFQKSKLSIPSLAMLLTTQN